MIEPPAHPNLAPGQTNSEQKTSEVKRLLIACSATKQPDPEMLPTLDRYQGTWFKVLHAYRRTHPQEAQTLDVWILSAEFGFIAATTPIPDYNRIMTPARRRELLPILQTQWATLRQTLFADVDSCYLCRSGQRVPRCARHAWFPGPGPAPRRSGVHRAGRHRAAGPATQILAVPGQIITSNPSHSTIYIFLIKHHSKQRKGSHHVQR